MGMSLVLGRYWPRSRPGHAGVGQTEQGSRADTGMAPACQSWHGAVASVGVKDGACSPGQDEAFHSGWVEHGGYGSLAVCTDGFVGVPARNDGGIEATVATASAVESRSQT